MKKETQSIIKNLENTLSGQPWFGRAVYEILEEVNEAEVNKKPGSKGHSMIELLYHMLTWAEFTLSRLEKIPELNLVEFEKMDWREIDPTVHGWEKGIEQLKKTHEQIVSILQKKDDAFLKEIVEEREYNFRFLLNGLIQHNIYHLGQIAYVKKLLS
ncbi:MAG: DinB family protein [Chitinophagaceae bacterium]|nr:MAG: DinB family protein [Chitinophagaceae bacterium]